jgi:hypothetical protein
MKRIVLLAVLLCAFILLGDFLNKIGADENENNRLEGYIVNKEGALYLITDQDFDVKAVKELSGEEFIYSYGGIYKVDNMPISFSKYEEGQKVKVWYDKILESHPAQLKVLKAEIIK